MKGIVFVLLFTAMTFLSWGAYGPVLHHGALALDHDSMRAFVGVGLAYFLIAVLIPMGILRKSGENGAWTLSGTIFSLVAGAVGAVGALGIILALGYGGQTVYVMPLVFGFAPVVNTLVTALLGNSFSNIRPIFIFGILTAALGAAGVLVFKPAKPPAEPAEVTESGVPEEEVEAAGPENTEAANNEAVVETENTTEEQEAPKASQESADSTQSSSESSEPSDGTGSGGESEEQADIAVESPDTGVPPGPKAKAGEEAPAEESQSSKDDTNEKPPSPDGEPLPFLIRSQDEASAEVASESDIEEGDEDESVATDESAIEGAEEAEADGGIHIPGIIGSIILAALCWGSYGPMLHIGQAKMKGSRLRPFACVGFAYFIIAVAVPIVLIQARSVDAGSWNFIGMSWSFLAGIAGAIGALGVILAFNAGGKPYYVMPLIFGFAPVINTFISLTEAQTWPLVTWKFWVSLGVVIAGAVTVLITAPKAPPKK